MASFQELINSEKPVLVDFFAEWCGPCKTMAPILQEVAGKVEGRARIVKIDVDKNQQVAQQLGIRSVPTLMIFQNSEVKWQQAGVVPADQLEALLNQFAA